MKEEFRELKREERGQAEHVITAVFGPGDSSIDEPGGHRDPWRDRDHMFGCLVDGKVVSVVHLMRRMAYVPGGQWTFGAIAGVSTLPEFRGRGYSTQLMRIAEAEMYDDGVDFGLLGTGINSFYKRLGWFDVPKTLMGLRMEEPVSIPLTAEIGKDISWEELAPIHEAFNEGRPFAVVRNPEYWQGWTEVWFRGATRLVIKDGSKPVAYAVARPRKEDMNLLEVGWLPERSEAAGLLADQILALMSSWSKARLGGEDIPYEPTLMQHLERPGVIVTREVMNPMMALPIAKPLEELKSHCRLLEEDFGAFWYGDGF